MERTEAQVWDVLSDVKDPEIPTVSVVDLGMVERVEVGGGEVVVLVEMIPTFLGCPALDLIRTRAKNALCEALALDPEQVRVEFRLSRAWSTERVSQKGRERLKAWGMAPPPSGTVTDFVAGTTTVACPLCASMETEVQNLFASAACRALYYCRACKNPFEVMKPI